MNMATEIQPYLVYFEKQARKFSRRIIIFLNLIHKIQRFGKLFKAIQRHYWTNKKFNYIRMDLIYRVCLKIINGIFAIFIDSSCNFFFTIKLLVV